MIEDAAPVLLVPGWSDRATFLEPLRLRFIEAGWDPGAVRALDFRDPHGSNRDHAAEIARAATEVVRAHDRVGAVDVVAHSMGGLALRHLLEHGRTGLVRRAAFLGTPHDGTWLAWLAPGAGAREMRPGSDFLAELPDRCPVPALAVHTPLDTHILPQRSAAWAAARTERVWTLHRRLVKHAPTFRAVKQFLLED